MGLFSIAIKRIAKYVEGVLDKEQGLLFKPTDNLTLDCYVDAEFSGLQGYADDQNPFCVKSRSGYVMTMGGCPINWTSRLQQEIALSTEEAEYISLAQALREFIPIHCAFENMLRAFNLMSEYSIEVKSTIFEDNNGAISAAITPKMSPRTKYIGAKYHFVKDIFGKKCYNDHHPFDLKKI